MAEFTPEPWEYHPDSRFVIAPTTDGESLLICEVTDTHEGLEGDCPAADANGLLLAAAPKLLAACKMLTVMCRRLGFDTPSMAGFEKTAYEQGLAAIAEATGKEGVAT